MTLLMILAAATVAATASQVQRTLQQATVVAKTLNRRMLSVNVTAADGAATSVLIPEAISAAEGAAAAALRFETAAAVDAVAAAMRSGTATAVEAALAEGRFAAIVQKLRGQQLDGGRDSTGGGDITGSGRQLAFDVMLGTHHQQLQTSTTSTSAVEKT